MQMTISTHGPDGATFLPPTTSECPDSWRNELTAKRRNRSLVKTETGIEFDSYCAGYWDSLADRAEAAYMNGIRTRVVFS